MNQTKILQRSILGLAACVAASMLVFAQDNDPDRKVQGGKMPAGWAVRPDRGDASQIGVSESGGKLTFAMGPAGTFYNPGWTKSGNYKYSARFTQTKKASHPTSYGISFGGKDIAGPMQTYSYFLVRQTGEFYIANRDGDQRPTAVMPWTANEAVVKEGGDGKQTNTLGVEVNGDNVIFSINGKEVARQPKSKLHTDGQIGFRIGHNLDIEVDQISK